MQNSHTAHFIYRDRVRSKTRINASTISDIGVTMRRSLLNSSAIAS